MVEPGYRLSDPRRDLSGKSAREPRPLEDKTAVRRSGRHLVCLMSLLTAVGLAFAQVPAQGAPASKGKNSQPVYGLSNQQTLSSALGAWGVPAAVLVGGKRVRGFYVTGLTGSGIAADLSLNSGDVVLTLAGRGVDSGPAVDALLTTTVAGNLKATIARVRGGRVTVSVPLISFQGYAPLPKLAAKPTTGTTGGSSGGFGSSMFKDPEDEMGEDAKPKERPSVEALESHMYQLVNADRAANGLPPVARSSALGRVARTFAEDMAARNYFNHQDPEGRWPKDRARAAGISAGVWENIGWQKNFNGFTRLIDQVQANFMNEPKDDPTNHRANILNRGHHCVGIGVAVVMPYSVICVQEFSHDDVP